MFWPNVENPIPKNILKRQQLKQYKNSKKTTMVVSILHLAQVGVTSSMYFMTHPMPEHFWQ